MRRSQPLVSLLLVGSLAACGGQSEPSPGESATTEATLPATTASAPASSAGPEFRILGRTAVKRALLTVDDLPPGYSQEPSEPSEGKTFCDYREPAEERVYVRRDFLKGGGLSAELLTISIRQYGSISDANAAWKALTKALKTCKGEEYDGSQLTYTRMSAPDLGDDSLGLKIDVDGVTLLQNFVLVGPAVLSGGGGGAVNADADTIVAALRKQVARYDGAARN